jgi:hypothetical protein
MNSYSHLVLAKGLEPYMRPEYSGHVLSSLTEFDIDVVD